MSDHLEWPGEAVGDASMAIAEALDSACLASAGGAYVRIFDPAARVEADAQSADRDQRPLAGFSLVVKDIMRVAGSPLGAGSALHDGHPAERQNAAIVTALRGQGAVPVGLATLHEFALGVTGVNTHTGTPRHPMDAERLPGGSSSGSAVAVATGSAALGIGTDTAGSIRIPAALCGVVGFKPAFGEYSVDGVFPLAPSLDHVGLLAPTVGAIRRAHAALGRDSGAARLPERVGVIDEHLASSDPAVRAAISSALDRMSNAGVDILPCDWPGADRSVATSTAILLPEAAAVHQRSLASTPGRFSSDVRERLLAGQRFDASRIERAQVERRLLSGEVAQTLEEFNIVIGPTVPMVAPPLTMADQTEVTVRLLRFTCLLNIVGVPALSLPATAPGLPIGFQLAAKSSPQLLGAAAAIEALLTGI